MLLLFSTLAIQHQASAPPLSYHQVNIEAQPGGHRPISRVGTLYVLSSSAAREEKPPRDPIPVTAHQGPPLFFFSLSLFSLSLAVFPIIFLSLPSFPGFPKARTYV